MEPSSRRIVCFKPLRAQLGHARALLLSDEFRTLANDGESEIKVRGSSFAGLAFAISSEQDFRLRLLERPRRYFDATHHCGAWRLRDGSWRTIDGGEPGGSAGVPILSAINGDRLTDCGVIVTRYFGGTKLGVGGLVRAYGAAADAALATAPRRIGVLGSRASIRYGYTATSVVMRCLDRFELFDLEHGYEEDGSACVAFTVRRGDLRALEELLRDESSGSLIVDRLADAIGYRQPGESALAARLKHS